MTKAAIPTVATGQLNLDRALVAIKQNIDEITAQARNVDRLDPLPSTASLADVIARLNTVVARLQ